MDVIELAATCYAVDRLAPSLHDYPTGLVLRSATAEEMRESEYAGESGAFRAKLRAEWLDEGARWRLRVIDCDDHGATLAVVDGDGRRITEEGEAVGLQPSRLAWPSD